MLLRQPAFFFESLCGLFGDSANGPKLLRAPEIALGLIRSVISGSVVITCPNFRQN